MKRVSFQDSLLLMKETLWEIVHVGFYDSSENDDPDF